MNHLLCFLNGQFLPIEKASISVTDRGFMFGDGVYELIPVYQGKLFRVNEHLNRLQHSLREIRLTLSVEPDWQQIFHRLITEHGSGNMSIYLQISRGAQIVRHHTFPQITEPTIFVRTLPYNPPTYEQLAKGFKAITRHDIRWQRCDIKSLNLLPNILLYNQALEHHAEDAILINDKNEITEATTSNVFIVKKNVLMTPPKSHHILGGITRDFVLELAQKNNIAIEESIISKKQLFAADEVWLTSSSKEIKPVISIDEIAIANGHVGPLWRRMIQIYKSALQSFVEN